MPRFSSGSIKASLSKSSLVRTVMMVHLKREYWEKKKKFGISAAPVYIWKTTFWNARSDKRFKLEGIQSKMTKF